MYKSMTDNDTPVLQSSFTTLDHSTVLRCYTLCSTKAYNLLI